MVRMLLGIIVSLVLLASAAFAQEELGPWPVLAHSLEAHGGITPIRAAGGITLHAQGTFDLTVRLQGRSPTRPELTPIEERLSVDTEAGVTAFHFQWRNYVHSEQNLTEVYLPTGQVYYGDLANGRGGWDASALVSDQAARYQRAVPNFLLDEMLASAQRVTVASGNQDFTTLNYTTEAGDQLTVHIDADTHLLARVETLIDMPVLGDITVAWEWSDYELSDNGLVLPHTLQMFLGDKVLKREELEFALRSGDIGIDMGALGTPPPFEAAAASAPAGLQAPDVRELGDGIYAVANLRPGFSGFIVEFDEFAVVVDAPSIWHEMQMLPPLNWSQGDTSVSLGAKYLAAVDEATGGKPLRYVVLSHHHTDHIGSLRALMSPEVTIVGSAETLSVVERAAAATLSLAGAAAAPAYQTVEVDGEYVISDGSRQLRLIELSQDNPQAEGYLVVHLPVENILYLTAFIYPLPEGIFPLAESVDASQWLVAWLDQNELADAEQFNVHGMLRVEPWQIEMIREF